MSTNRAEADRLTSIVHREFSRVNEPLGVLLADSLSMGASATGCLSDSRSADALHRLGFPQVEISPSSALQEVGKPVVLAACREAVQAANNHLGELVGFAANMPPGKIDVAAQVMMAESLANKLGIKPEEALAKIGLQSEAKAFDMLKNIQCIEKTPDGHVIITQKSAQILPLGTKDHGGHLDDIKLGQTISFDLKKGSEQISNIQGLTVEGHGGVPERKLVSTIQDIDVAKDSAGKTVIKIEASNPEYIWEKVFTGDFGPQIPVEVQLQDDGRVVLTQHNKKTTVGHIG